MVLGTVNGLTRPPKENHVYTASGSRETGRPGFRPNLREVCPMQDTPSLFCKLLNDDCARCGRGRLTYSEDIGTIVLPRNVSTTLTIGTPDGLGTRSKRST
jgi:hypothetical protein